MNTHRLPILAALLAALAANPPAHGQGGMFTVMTAPTTAPAATTAADKPATKLSDPDAIKLSDPAKPGILKVKISHGNVRIHGTDATDVAVRTQVQSAKGEHRSDGLRVLSASTGYMLTEKDNTVTLDYATDGWTGAGGPEFEVSVPRATAIVVTSPWGGDVTCSDISGNIDIRVATGHIRLEGVSGGALVETSNGDIDASIREVHEGRALSFTSVNGKVDIRVPANAKANVSLRTRNGTILTDFDEQALVTKTEVDQRGGLLNAVRVTGGGGYGGYGMVGGNQPFVGGSAAARDATAARATNEAKAAAEATIKAQELDALRSRMAIIKQDGGAFTFTLPAMTGGKIVSGTLNGGGPEIQAATMGGDVIVRKLMVASQ